MRRQFGEQENDLAAGILEAGKCAARRHARRRHKPDARCRREYRVGAGRRLCAQGEQDCENADRTM
ncbi:MAG: hypothetical protein M5U33_09055 [Pseudorhodoplanes sp.]|nr:hypothetical protein [Pseudorhodoplanes sp.]